MDINSDVGELNNLLADNTYEKLMDHVNSVNIACGGHAGGETMMEAMINIAIIKNGISSLLKWLLETLLFSSFLITSFSLIYLGFINCENTKFIQHYYSIYSNFLPLVYVTFPIHFLQYNF